MNTKQPEWISEPLSPADIAAVLQGGCSSGAYMPAVTYWQAMATMARYGDDVLDYLQSRDELEQPPLDSSWSGMAVFYLSRAVECWCAEHEDLADWDNDEPLEVAA